MRNEFSFLQWNCRSIGKNIPYLIQHLKNTNYEIILLQALNIQLDKTPKIPGYYYPPLTSHNTTTDKLQTAIYIKIDIKYTQLKIQDAINLENTFITAASILLPDNTTLNIASVYLPKGPIEDNTDWLKLIGTKLSNKGKWVIGGDFNAHSPLWEKDCKITTSNRFVENITDSDLMLLNDGRITRIPDNQNHRPTSIDLTLISPTLYIDSTWDTLTDTLGSDHVPIRIELRIKNASSNNYTESNDAIPKYSYKKANWDKFRKIITSQTFHTDKIDKSDVNYLYSVFQENIIQAANQSIPICKLKKRDERQGNIWWSEECEEAVKVKKKAFKEYIKNKSTINFDLMKAAKNHCNKIINNAKRTYWNSFCMKEITTPKDINKLWKKIKTIKNSNNLPSNPILLNNKTIPTDKEKAEIFVDTFSRISKPEGLLDINKTYREKVESDEYITNNENIKDSYINAEITQEELNDALNDIKQKSTSVGSDIISNPMLSNLPSNAISFLLKFFQKCWTSKCFPSIWKESIVVPIHKQGKPPNDIKNYRPIALTSHTCKLFERIILNRLTHFCNKNNVIPKNQAGFTKNRSSIEHLLKLTTEIKHQFSRRQSLLVTFFDVQKAYDQVWHFRLLQKLTHIGITGNMLYFIKNLIEQRQMITRVGNTYSSRRTLSMGLPQGSILSPILFNILTYDLPNIVTSDTTIVQYADDICMWKKVNLKQMIKKRMKKYIKQTYQNNLDNLEKYMTANGLTISTEKTNLILFNAGEHLINLPTFKLYDTPLIYKNNTKFLGLTLTSKLSWSLHIENILSKARKNLNIIKILSKFPWGMDPQTLIHISTAIIRSVLTYGQEIYFSAPLTLLNRLQSIDSKAYKLALGIPIHTQTNAVYQSIGILSLNEHRKLASSKYIIKANLNNTFIKEEIKIRSDTDFPKRAQKINSQQTIATYTKEVFNETNIHIKENQNNLKPTTTPKWELPRPKFDIHYTDLTKDENINILSTTAKLHCLENYSNHLHVYTDGSLLDNGECGAAFSIPQLKLSKSYYLGTHLSIFTAELTAIMMALNFLMDFVNRNKNVVIFVDSLSVLKTLKNFNLKTRPDLVNEIYQLLYQLFNKGSDISFCWIPSHCNILGNEQADKAAKQGAQQKKKTLQNYKYLYLLQNTTIF